MKTPFCLLITGEPNSGKSTIEFYLRQKRLRNCLPLDGDKHRQMQFLGEKLGFTHGDIMRNNEHVIKMALYAQAHGFNVIVPQIMPYKEQREQFHKRLRNVYEVYLSCPKTERADRPNFRDSDLVYELGVPDLELQTDQLTIDECVDSILELLE